MARKDHALPVERISQAILIVRGHRVMLDSALAELYEIETRALVQAVARNPNRFPPDFCFRISAEEAGTLRSQIVISNGGRGGRRYPPYAFTEQGVAMLSSVIRSPTAIAVNMEIMRAFVHLRRAVRLIPGFPRGAASWSLARAASASLRTRRMSASVNGPFTPEMAASFMPCLRPRR